MSAMRVPVDALRPPAFMATLVRGQAVEPATFPGPAPGFARPATGPRAADAAFLERAAADPGADRSSAPAAADLAETTRTAERLTAAVERLVLTSERLAAEARTDALEVAFLVARRILEAEVSTGIEPLLGLVRSALRKLGESRRIVIRLSPRDAAAVTAALAARGAATLAAGSAQIEIVTDATLSGGDCVVEGDLGAVDGRLDTRLSELRRAIAAEVVEASP